MCQAGINRESGPTDIWWYKINVYFCFATISLGLHGMGSFANGLFKYVTQYDYFCPLKFWLKLHSSIKVPFPLQTFIPFVKLKDTYIRQATVSFSYEDYSHWGDTHNARCAWIKCNALCVSVYIYSYNTIL